jgi:hypothetical protein
MPREIPNKKIKDLGDYLDRVYKLIPAELAAAYCAAQSFLGVPEDPKDNIFLLSGFGIFLTILVPFYLMRLQGVSNIWQIVVSTISLPVWAANISILYVGLILAPMWPKIFGLGLIGWVLVTPLLVGKTR